jgi:hypothetical protein
MRRYLCVSAGLLAATFMLAPSVGAQAPPPEAPPNIVMPQPTPDPGVASAPVTLTGCLQRPQATAPGQQDKPHGVTPASAFVLRTAGASGQPPVTYHLIASTKSIDLSSHLNHRVEITGTLRAATNKQPGMSNEGVSPSTPSGSTGVETIPQPPGDAPGHGEPGKLSSSSASAGHVVAQPLFVTSVKMIDAQCSAPTE